MHWFHQVIITLCIYRNWKIIPSIPWMNQMWSIRTSSVALLAVLCTTVTKVAALNTSDYWYDVLGRLHTATAKKELHQGDTSKPLLKKVLAKIYYVGLTRDEALRIGSRHNYDHNNGHCIHRMISSMHILHCNYCRLRHVAKSWLQYHGRVH